MLQLLRDYLFALPPIVRFVVTMPPAASFPVLRSALGVLPHTAVTSTEMLRHNDIQVSAPRGRRL
jgi:hypothetical protein